jgi:hypothetical protein
LSLSDNFVGYELFDGYLGLELWKKLNPHAHNNTSIHGNVLKRLVCWISRWLLCGMYNDFCKPN